MGLTWYSLRRRGRIRCFGLGWLGRGRIGSYLFFLSKCLVKLHISLLDLPARAQNSASVTHSGPGMVAVICAESWYDLFVLFQIVFEYSDAAIRVCMEVQQINVSKTKLSGP